MALPPPLHNSENLRGEIAYRRERLMKRSPSFYSTVGMLFVLPLLAIYWLIRLLLSRATGRYLPGPALWVSRDADQSANCAGSGRASSGGPLARCSQCGKYVGLSHGRLLVHSR